MLTQNSYVAIDFFASFMKSIKNSAVKQLCLFFEQFEVDYEIVSMIDEQKSVSYESLQTVPFRPVISQCGSLSAIASTYIDAKLQPNSRRSLLFLKAVVKPESM